MNTTLSSLSPCEESERVAVVRPDRDDRAPVALAHRAGHRQVDLRDRVRFHKRGLVLIDYKPEEGRHRANRLTPREQVARAMRQRPEQWPAID